MFQITKPLLIISVTVPLAFTTLSLLLLKGCNFYYSPSPHKMIPHNLLLEISGPTRMASELILKELQATWFKLTRTIDLQNITQQNQTQLKYQRSRFPDRVKPEWTFVVTIYMNLEIYPVSRRMNWHTGKGQIKARQSLNQETADYW